VTPETVTCPSCGLVLKAYGHPGLHIYRSQPGTFLCETCAYHADDTCDIVKRPFVQDCTLYQDIHESPVPEEPARPATPALNARIYFWLEQNPVFILLIIVLAIVIFIFFQLL
jgi:hypothetical protein